MKIPVDKLVRFTGTQIAKIDATTLASLGGKYWDKVPVYHIAHFGVELVQSAGMLEKLNATQIAYFTDKQWKAVPVEAIDYVALGAWTKEEWDKYPIDTIAAFVDQQIQAVPPEVVGQCFRVNGVQMRVRASVSARFWIAKRNASSCRRQMDTGAVAEIPNEADCDVHGRATRGWRECA